jgi:hypothetical protein
VVCGVRVEGHAPCVVCMLQVPLMAEVPRARAALDAHVGVAGVAEQGLLLLWNLAVAQANKVRPRVCVGGRVGSGMCVGDRGRAPSGGWTAVGYVGCVSRVTHPVWRAWYRCS